MTMLERAREILRDGEVMLRNLVAESANDGDYAAVIELTEWAQTLSAMRRKSPGPKIECPKEKRVRGSDSSSSTQRLRKRKGRHAAAEQANNGAYPKFERRFTELVKIGWSKRLNETYEHRAPWTVVQEVAAALLEASNEDDYISAPELTPLAGPNQEPIPDYQVYLCLAWLRQDGLIQQHGRQGYTIPNKEDFIQSVFGKWERMATSI